MYTNAELREFISENDIKFIRLSFVDLDGTQKNVAVMADLIDDILENGLTINSTIVDKETNKNIELCLYPDINTLHILPWRPQHGRVARFICDIKNIDKTDSYFDSRHILKKVVSDLKKNGLNVNIGTDSEFYLFKTDENNQPTYSTLDEAGYLDISPLDKSENVRREVCLTLEEMNIKPLSSHHEKGPGQNEINFIRTGALEACDNYVIFKSVVKAISNRNGVFASFMPKPIDNKNGNGLALNIDIAKDGESIFNNEKLKNIADGFIAGILNRSKLGTILFNSCPNSFERIGSCNAPKIISFNDKQDAFMRLAHKNGKKRLEIRSCDNSCNLYLLVSYILASGLEGIINNELIDDFKETNLPTSFNDAIVLATENNFMFNLFGEKTFETFLKSKINLANEYTNVNDITELKKRDFLRL